ncbi:Maf family protein [Aneurinibacillus aneurinilyticus]|uniref:dTTP/UTP pyrophosphatase n=1 Tax=Aneurinibacillus aneurinilyticus TaxID=1391 RepID=A0A848CT70_ANEAE|nr:Maf family protein [Aneurinibacillus aneurinilyticus]NME99003.1 septum formation inhibitor Maf [Aneurinibacillus aneurinilyticus]
MSKANQPSIVLASASARRKELLAGLGLTFTVQPSVASEVVEEDVSPEEFVTILARRKARDVAFSLADNEDESYLVIGSDTVVVLDGEILGKPEHEEDAFRMLSGLQGRTHTVYTGLCVINTASGKEKAGFRATNVTMRELGAERIRRYIATGEPMDKAGAYGIQGYGALLVSNLEGDYFSVVGLPVSLVSDFLEEFGVKLL